MKGSRNREGVRRRVREGTRGKEGGGGGPERHVVLGEGRRVVMQVGQRNLRMAQEAGNESETKPIAWQWRQKRE